MSHARYLLAALALLAGCRREPPSYVGVDTCAECHAERTERFRGTAHYRTSSLPDASTMRGHHDPERAVLLTRNPDVSFEMTAEPDGYFQTAVLRGDGEPLRRKRRVDLVIGSGKIGQTYLYWQGSSLYELPVSYFAEADRWMNSPGYEDGTASFGRPILPRCLECHTTFAGATSRHGNEYRRGSLVLGVTCERCHGPGSEHAAYHRAHPGEQVARHVVHPRKLSRERALEVCAQCHAGEGGPPRAAPFSYRPGAVLAEHLDLDVPSEDAVHTANQLARLQESRCFSASPELTCASCHDPHRVERGDSALFARRCAKCHEHQGCGLELAPAMRTRCVDCHMPRLRDAKLPLEEVAGITFPLVRDHRIAIYREETERVLRGP